MTHSNDIVLRIRWTEGPDISLNISPSFDTPCTLKDLIHQTTQHTSNKRLRLVYNGKILDDDMKPLGDYGIQSTGTFIHCMVSEYVSTDLTKIVNKKPSRTGGGFDRLLTLGFNQEEICNIRAQFHRTRQTPYDGQEPTEQLQQLEEQWMDQTGEVLPEGCKYSTGGLCLTNSNTS
ncbi:hypothetical protein BC941DRAFT_409091 [Chlamydoabsidia padenii]|nr:hypothetical protein BC941DRAFT_409091 [Chlamydoabsidia padenii]